jgi:hypothetical protein
MIAYLPIAVMSLILSTTSINLSYLSYLKPMAVVCLILLIWPVVLLKPCSTVV